MADNATLEERVRELLDAVPSAPADGERVILRHRQRRTTRLVATSGSLLVAGVLIVAGTQLWPGPAVVMSPATSSSGNETSTPSETPEPSPTPTDSASAGQDSCDALLERNISTEPDLIIDPLVIDQLEAFAQPLGATITHAMNPVDCVGTGSNLTVDEAYGLYFASDQTYVEWSAQTAGMDQWQAWLAHPKSTPASETTVIGYPALLVQGRFAYYVYDEAQEVLVQFSGQVGNDRQTAPSAERQDWILNELLPRILDRSLAPSADGRSDTSDESTNADGVQAPRLQEAELEALATDAGLSVDRMTAEGNLLDGGFLDPSGAYIAITITTAAADEIAAAVEHGIAERPYVEVTIAGHDAYYRQPARPGDGAHWLLTSTDGTQMISVNALPPGTDADGNPVPASVTGIVERDLIPALAGA
ncbi:hypothetical protein [Occultella kanbiaonis]|uniref:hypothetical protein n=1 Tax=Occultella kanbiaonis TaxID=2675754 RepID=UPI0013D402FD|nr:hypothetical protein [Occultella kanbiaonis]